MNFVFLMDPLNTVVMEKDTSFILMLASHRKGHKVYYLPSGGMSRKNGKVYFHVTEVIPQQVEEQPFIEKKQQILNDESVDVVFVRTDPPFDEEYLFNTWLLDLLPQRVLVVNNPKGIRTVNEKIWATQFTSVVPATLISRNKEDMTDFISTEKEVVAKPTYGHGGKSVFLIKKNDLNTSVILETLTQNWSEDIILQKYVPQAKNGDKRILLLNGEFLGAVLRLHADDDHRNNFFAGGKPVKTEITKRDREIINLLKPKLQELGLYFVGIDVIGNHLIEVNVTSPTALQEAGHFVGIHLENKVIDFVEKLAA